MDKITDATVVRIAAQILADSPHRVNPTRDNNPNEICVYTSPEGRHCLAGEMLFRLDKAHWLDCEGIPVDSLIQNHDPMGREVSGAAKKLMMNFQIAADRQSEPDGGRPTWQKAINEVLSSYKVVEPMDSGPPTEVIKKAQKAVNAALRDSNDKEIDLLRDALEEALTYLGLPMPEPQKLYKYRYVVTIQAENMAQADQVAAERLGPDEDYGFEYRLEYHSEGRQTPAYE